MDYFAREVVKVVNQPGRICPDLRPLQGYEIGWLSHDGTHVCVRVNKLMKLMGHNSISKRSMGAFRQKLVAAGLTHGNYTQMETTTGRSARVLPLRVAIPANLSKVQTEAWTRLWAGWPTRDGKMMELSAAEIVRLVDSLQIKWLKARCKGASPLHRAKAMGTWLFKMRGKALCGYTLRERQEPKRKYYTPALAGSLPGMEDKVDEIKVEQDDVAAAQALVAQAQAGLNGTKEVEVAKVAQVDETKQPNATPWPAGATNGPRPKGLRASKARAAWDRIGFVSDTKLAAEIGASCAHLRNFRARYGIPAWWRGETVPPPVPPSQTKKAKAKAHQKAKAKKTASKPWPEGATNGPRPETAKGKIAECWDLLGFKPDAEIAKMAQVAAKSVATFRYRNGIPAWHLGQTEAVVKPRKAKTPKVDKQNAEDKAAREAEAEIKAAQDEIVKNWTPAVPEWPAYDPRYDALKPHFAGQKQQDVTDALAAEVAKHEAAMKQPKTEGNKKQYDATSPVAIAALTEVAVVVNKEWLRQTLSQQLDIVLPEIAGITLDDSSGATVKVVCRG